MRTNALTVFSTPPLVPMWGEEWLPLPRFPFSSVSGVHSLAFTARLRVTTFISVPLLFWLWGSLSCPYCEVKSDCLYLNSPSLLAVGSISCPTARLKSDQPYLGSPFPLALHSHTPTARLRVTTITSIPFLFWLCGPLPCPCCEVNSDYLYFFPPILMHCNGVTLSHKCNFTF